MKKQFYFVLILILFSKGLAQTPTDPLVSWNDGPAKRAILDFVKVTTDPKSPQFVPPAKRIATFDNDGTLWVEKPIYTQLAFAIDRITALAAKHPEWENQQRSKPFSPKTAKPSKS